MRFPWLPRCFGGGKQPDLERHRVDLHATSGLQEGVGPVKHGQTAELRYRSVSKLALKLGGRTRAIWADRRGVAAVEFGFFAIILSLALANVTDVSIYIYQRMQVENATE